MSVYLVSTQGLHSLGYEPAFNLAGIDLVAVLLGLLLVALGCFLATRRMRRLMARISESERRNRCLVEGSPNGICLLDESGCFLAVNQLGLRMMGRPEGELIGRPFHEIWPAGSRCLVQNAVRGSAQGACVSFEAVFADRAGSPLTWEVKLSPVLASGGKIVQFVAIISDITGRKRIEEKLKIAQFTIDCAADSIMWIDGETRFYDCNPAACAELGYSRAELLNLSVFDIDPDWTPAKFKQYWALGGSAGARRFETRHRRKDGRIIPVEVVSTPLKLGDQCLFVAFSRDMSAFKRAEQALREERDFSTGVLNSTPAVVCGLAPDGTARFINPAAETVTGYKASEVIGRNWWDLFYPGNERCQVDEFLRRIERDREVRDYEMTLTTRMLQKRIIAWTSLNRWDETGNLIEIVGFGYDVTERKRTEHQLQAAQRDLQSHFDALLSIAEDASETKQQLAEANARLERAIQQANQMATQAQEASVAKSTFLASMSHEIRTPLNGVVGMIDLLMGGKLGPEQQRYCRIARQSADMLLGLLNNVLDFSKIEAGRLELDLAPFDLHAAIAEVVEAFAHRADEKGLELTASIASEAPREVFGDAVRVRQILANLIGNAVKFTQQGHVDVRASLVERTDLHTVVRFRVADTGIGISPAEQERLFQPFSQADASTTRKFGGTGLGLVICKCLTELMGGEIGVESEPGAGSAFWFTVRFQRAGEPARDASPRAPHASLITHHSSPITQDSALALSSSAPEPGPGAPPERPLRILLAEDNQINQTVAGEMLRHLGHACEVVPNGREAVEAVRRGGFDLVLMDCQMPEMDGLAAARRIRELESQPDWADPADQRPPHIPIIALTANAIKGDREACLAAGMDDYLAKPVEIQTFARTIGNVLYRLGRASEPESGPSPDRESPAASSPPPAERADGPPIDIETLLNRCLGNAKLAGELLDRFAGQLNGTLTVLEGHLASTDAEALTRAAHTLKGSAASMSAAAVSRCAARLEQLGRQGHLEEAEREMSALAAEVERCLRHLPEVKESILSAGSNEGDAK